LCSIDPLRSISSWIDGVVGIAVGFALLESLLWLRLAGDGAGSGNIIANGAWRLRPSDVVALRWQLD
jgi:hypothetical protein